MRKQVKREEEKLKVIKEEERKSEKKLVKLRKDLPRIKLEHKKIKEMIENHNINQMSNNEIEYYESFREQKGDYVFNAFTYAIVNNNLNAAKYLVDTCKINLAEMFSIYKLDQEQGNPMFEEGQDKVILNTKLTLKAGIDTGNYQIFIYLL